MIDDIDISTEALHIFFKM